MFRRNLITVPSNLSAVTTIATDREVEPRQAGMQPGGRDAIWSAVEGLYKSGVQPAIGFCLRRGGQVVIDRTIGHSSGNGPKDTPDTPKVLATPDTPFCLFSASKAMTAMMIHHLDETNRLRVGDRVCEYIPEFATNGKDRISIRHVLNHRAGLPSVSNATDLDMLRDWDGIVNLLCETTPAWIPGRKHGYHPLTGGFILGEIIQRITGMTVRDYFRKTFLDPMGIAGLDIGVSERLAPTIARNYFTGPQPPPPLGYLFSRALGVRLEDAADLANDHRFLTAVVPSGNICGTANETARFYQMLLNEGELDGTRVLQAKTVRRAVIETSYGTVDSTLGLPVRYGLGFMLGHKTFSLYGPSTERAFGHIGFTQVWTWADPERDVAVALLTTGKPFLSTHLIPTWGILSAIAKHCPPAGQSA